jgi:hypothetical protein
MSRYIDDVEAWADAEDWADAQALTEADDLAGWSGSTSVLREILHEDYADADDETCEAVLDAVLDGMSPEESFDFTRALRQIERSAGQALANPVVADLTRTALPIGAGALGTLIGGPAGTAIGSQLGSLAAGALVPPGRPPSPSPATAAAVQTPATLPAAGGSTAAGGSMAAAQAAALTQQPDVLKALLAAALGQYGTRQVGGIPVAAVMSKLSQVFGEAAADADELAYLEGDPFEPSECAAGSGRPSYPASLDAEDEE